MSRILTVLVAGLMAFGAAPAQAGDCTGYTVGLRPISQYNHTKGNGFLAVRTGPGSRYSQLGELYLGDEIVVMDRSGSWYYVGCMTGRCLNPLWGQPNPTGWVYGKYITFGGVCP